MSLARVCIPTHRQLIIVYIYAALLFCYYLTFRDFFPNRQGLLGNDYTGVLPGLLDGYFWIRNNSIFSIPWFTPSFCGGQPYFANTGGGFFTVPVFLTLFFDPLQSVKLSLLLFAAFGAWGMHRLLKDVFGSSDSAAILAGALFLFNGFYSHRLLSGHLVYHAFMTLPWVAWVLLYPAAGVVSPAGTRMAAAFRWAFAGVLLAYWATSGFVTLAPAGGLAVLAVAGMALARSGLWRLFMVRSAAVFALALAIAASPLAAGQAFISLFPRTDYPLPGFQSVAAATMILLKALFLAPSDIEQLADSSLVNVRWHLERYELEFGVSIVPLILIALRWLSHPFCPKPPKSATPGPGARVAAWAMAGVCLVLPLAINVYEPGWNGLLKQTPFLASSSTLIRWWLVYIPAVAVYAALCLDRLCWPDRHKSILLLLSLVMIVVLNGLKDREFYHAQSYDPANILVSYYDTRAGRFHPGIQRIGRNYDSSGNPQSSLSLGVNDIFTRNASQLTCYNAMFGYLLEYLPFRTLHEGDIHEALDGRLNIKNPACYVFPEENHCRPGDHFLVTESKEADRFAHYQPFRFAFSTRQRIANAVSIGAILMAITTLLVTTAYGVIDRIRSTGRSP